MLPRCYNSEDTETERKLHQTSGFVEKMCVHKRGATSKRRHFADPVADTAEPERDAIESEADNVAEGAEASMTEQPIAEASATCSKNSVEVQTENTACMSCLDKVKRIDMLEAKVKKLRQQCSELQEREQGQKLAKFMGDTQVRFYTARHPALKSGAGAEDSEDGDSAKAWVFYNHLLFLKDSIVGRPTSGNLELLCDEESEITERPRTDETAKSIFEDIISETSTSPEPDTYQATRREVSLGTAVQASTASSQSSQKRKKPYDDEISSLAAIVSRVPDKAEHILGSL
ncbi:hypothetical protein MTO96_040522 [Rhipicephalus appendiculatus]